MNKDVIAKNSEETEGVQRYEVHASTLCQGWVNCWRVTDDNGIDRPERFASIEAAQIEIDGLIADIQAEINRGERAENEGYNLEEYAIYDRVKEEYVTKSG